MRFILFCTFVVMLLNLLGCSKGKFGGSTASKEDHVLIYPLPNNPTTLDPAAVEDGDTIDVLHQIFEGLVTWNEDTEVIPNLAERWELSDDHLTYTFHLKKGVKFHNGEEMTAHDVKYSWDRAANPAVQSPTAAGYMVDIVGVEDVLQGRASSISGVEVVDDYTLKVQIKEAKPYWIQYLEYPCFYVVPKSTQLQPIQDIKDAIGTGPFVLSELKDNQFVEMTRFDDYHMGPPKLKKVRRIIQGDAQIRRQLYEAGEVDWIQLERQDLRMVKSNSELSQHLKIVDRPAIWYIGFDLDEVPAFKDKRVRQAIAMAIDKDRIIRDGFDGINLRADGIVPPGVPGYDENFKGLPYDPEKAKQLLAQAGFPNGKGFPKVNMVFRVDRQDPKMVVQMVQQDLQKNLGIDIQPQGMEWGTLLKLRADGTLPLFHLRWHADYPDPQNFLSFMLRTGVPENKLGYSNPEFDRLCDLGDREFDEAKRLEYYAKAQEIAVDDAIWIPIYFQRDLELIRPSVKGIKRSLMGPLPLIEVDVVWER